MKIKIKLFYIWITFFMMISVVFADYEIISKNPSYLKRGPGYSKAKIVNYLKKELHKANYSIIKDPTGSSPFELVENFSPRKGDCGNFKSFGGKMGGQTDCNSDRLRLEVGLKKELRTGKKAKEYWYGYYFFIPNKPDNFVDKFLQPYITQFYGYNHEGGQDSGGYAPQVSASISHGKLYIAGAYVIDEGNLKGKWHKVEFNIKWSKQYDGFVKVYINDELKVDRHGFKTAHHDYVEFKYGTYNHKDFGYTYPNGYQFPSHTIYFAGFSINKDRAKLKVNNIDNES